MREFIGQTFAEERALYGIKDALVRDCQFAGLADGESALKECSNVQVRNCHFALRYPLWHLHAGSMEECSMSETCRAALWYASQVKIQRCKLHGIKVVRECDQVELEDCDIDSSEFAWMCRDLNMRSCQLKSEYPFLQCQRLNLQGLTMKAKYSFQYVSESQLSDCQLDTKDAFWHANNITVKDSLLKGEYLAWYSQNLTLINCKIIGTQPLCYCRNLKLIDCQMEDCDLAFENSEVEATITGHITSIKQPAAGSIVADSIGDVITEQALPSCKKCNITCRQ